MSNSVAMNSPNNLFVAVSKAMGRPLDPDRFDDRLMLQKGCYILNRWGYGPMFDFDQYIRGPYSSDLEDECYRTYSPDGSTNVSDQSISDLSDILKEGTGYTEAYATLMLVKDHNPDANDDIVLKRTRDIKPGLLKEIDRAATCLL